MVRDPAIVTRYHTLSRLGPIASLVIEMPWEKLVGGI